MIGDRLFFSLLLMEAIASQSQTADACGWLQLWQKWAMAIALVLLKLRYKLNLICNFPRQMDGLRFNLAHTYSAQA
jgi:hypothetical protein